AARPESLSPPMPAPRDSEVHNAIGSSLRQSEIYSGKDHESAGLPPSSRPSVSVSIPLSRSADAAEFRPRQLPARRCRTPRPPERISGLPVKKQNRGRRQPPSPEPPLFRAAGPPVRPLGDRLWHRPANGPLSQCLPIRQRQSAWVWMDVAA